MGGGPATELERGGITLIDYFWRQAKITVVNRRDNAAYLSLEWDFKHESLNDIVYFTLPILSQTAIVISISCRLII